MEPKWIRAATGYMDSKSSALKSGSVRLRSRARQRAIARDPTLRALGTPNGVRGSLTFETRTDFDDAAAFDEARARVKRAIKRSSAEELRALARTDAQGIDRYDECPTFRTEVLSPYNVWLLCVSGHTLDDRCR